MNSTVGQTSRDGKIKLKVKKRRKTISSMPLKCVDNIVESKPSTQKRINPFTSNRIKDASKDVKKVKVDERFVFGVLESRENEIHKPQTRTHYSEYDTVSDDSPGPINPLASYDVRNKEYTIAENLPIDWSVKTKLHFTTASSVGWCSSLRSGQEALGVASFARCSQEDLHQPGDARARLHSILHNWVHPNIPWLPTFPLTSKKASQTGVKMSVTDSTEVQFLWKSWSHSFRSVFNLTRTGFCPYFYMYAHNMVCLFLSPLLRSETAAVIITPTTKGFRTMLDKEGITYSMPHLDKSAVEDDIESSDKENDCMPTDPLPLGKLDHEDEFLESIGLKKDQFPSIESSKKTEERIRLRAIDQRHSSTVVVAKQDSLSIFNFFLNSNILLASSGIGQGIPPTIYAPAAYEGATLQDSKFSARTIKQKANGIIEKINSVDITGLLFPHQIFQLCKLFQQQNKTFSLSMTSQQQSSSLNAPIDQEVFCTAEGSTESKQASFGLAQADLKHFQSNDLAKGVINNLQMTGNGMKYLEKD